MLEEPNPSKMFCLYNPDSLLTIPVSTELTEEFKGLSLPADYVPDQITPLGSLPDDIYRSVVSVGSTVYCIGGSKRIQLGVHQPRNEVTKVHVYERKFKLESCCDMIQPRASPAVVSICGKIYVFGGLPFGEKNCSDYYPWGEFLDTNEPESEQKWKPLEEPPFRVSQPYAIQYEAQTILIGSSRYMEQGAVIYNVADKSSPSAYKFEAAMLYTFVRAPVTILSTKTMYWIDDTFLIAYELDTHVRYWVSMHDLFPNFSRLFINAMQGPVLVHLKGDLFNMFTMFGLSKSNGEKNGLVECIKFRVTKSKLKAGDGVLHVDRVGYKSYKCKSMWEVCGALPIAGRQS